MTISASNGANNAIKAYRMLSQPSLQADMALTHPQNEATAAIVAYRIPTATMLAIAVIVQLTFATTAKKGLPIQP